MATPLIYFSYGMTRTGSTLAFELVRASLEYCGFPQPKLQSDAIIRRSKINLVQHINQVQIDALQDEINDIGYPIVLKTHTRPDDPSVVHLMQTGAAIGHAVYRDPRDMALSMVDSGHIARSQGTPGFSEIETLDDAFENIRHQTNSLTAWLRLPGIMPLYFEDVAFDTKTTAEKLLHQLGLTADAGFIASHVRARRFTQKNKASRQRFINEMPIDQSNAIATEFAPMLDRLITHRATLPTNGDIVLPPPHELRTSA